MRKSILFFLILSLVFLFSCHLKNVCPECETEAPVWVKFHWNEIEYGYIPKGMTVLFYDLKGDLSYTYLHVPDNGEKVNVAAGRYHIACYNNDSEYVQWRKLNNIYTLEAFMRETSIEGSSKSSNAIIKTDEILVNSPDMIYGQVAYNVDIKADNTETQIEWLNPRPLIDTYTYKATIIVTGHSTNIYKAAASLSGLRSGLLLFDPQSVNTSVSMVFANNKYQSDKSDDDDIKAIITLTGEMQNFGSVDNDAVRNVLNLYLWASNNKFRLQFDVTDQVRSQNADHPEYVHIVVATKIELDGPIGEGDDGGLDPSVNDWVDREYEIIL